MIGEGKHTYGREMDETIDINKQELNRKGAKCKCNNGAFVAYVKRG